MSTASVPANDLLRIVARAGEIVGSYGNSRAIPERVCALTRAELTVEHVHQELSEFIKFVYRRDGKGRLLHVLPDGQLAKGVHTPWRGPSTLTRTQQDGVRAWLKLKFDSRLKPVFYWADETKRWYVDLRRYPNVEAALDWLERHQLTAGEWLNLLP